MNNNGIRVKVNEWIFIQNINTNKYSKKCKKLTWTVVLKNKFWKELKQWKQSDTKLLDQQIALCATEANNTKDALERYLFTGLLFW